MGNVNCCEQPKEFQNKEEIETHLTIPFDSKTKIPSEPNNYKEVFKAKSHMDKKSEKATQIQSIVKRFFSKSRFINRVEIQRKALIEFFNTQGVLCEVDDINHYVSPKVLKVIDNINKREGIYSNINIPSNLMQTIPYTPIYSFEMPCTYLIDKYEDKFDTQKSLKDYSTTPPSDAQDKIFTPPQKPVYKGFWSIDKKKNGYGIFVNSEGSMYEGLFRNGKLDGKGRYITIKGDFFEGTFANGVAQGEGIFIHSDGSIYIGTWMNDLPWGEGIEWSVDGSFYKGDFYQGKKFGIGEFKWKDGSVYVGGVMNDLLNGEGIYTWADGKKFKGYWQNNCMHGYGILENIDGTKYEGLFEKSKKHGRGVYHYNNEKYYEGNWSNGKQHGKGKIVKNDAD